MGWTLFIVGLGLLVVGGFIVNLILEMVAQNQSEQERDKRKRK